MKVKDIDKKYQESMKDFQVLIEKQNEAKRNAELYQTEAENAAIAGDVDTFKELKTKASDAEALAYVLQKKIEACGAEDVFTKDEIKDAWKDYADDYNKTLSAKLKKFRETKTDLLRQYADLVALQRDACAVRERLARYIGIEKKSGMPDYGLGGFFDMDYIPCLKITDVGHTSINGANIEDPDAVYYLSSKAKRPEEMYKDPDAVCFVSVVKMHQA